jgi:hypothetical protein
MQKSINHYYPRIAPVAAAAATKGPTLHLWTWKVKACHGDETLVSAFLKFLTDKAKLVSYRGSNVHYQFCADDTGFQCCFLSPLSRDEMVSMVDTLERDFGYQTVFLLLVRTF